MTQASLFFPKRPYRTGGGVKLPHHKATADAPSVRMPPPALVTLPMQQHVGAPCRPVVRPGDPVFLGQVIGDSDRPVSAPIHASVSGTVKQIVSVWMQNGQAADAVVIESDGKMTPDPALAPPKCDTLPELIAAVRASGLVGLGGAGFPAAVKLNVPVGKRIDTILINGAECEPYITADTREAIENSWDVLSGVHTLRELLGADRVIIGVESNKPDAIAALRAIADNSTDPEDRIRVLPLPCRYPQGAEKVLVQSCTGRVIPQGGLPADVGCLVMNLTSVAFLARYLKTGMPLVSKRVTVDGSAVAHPQNVIVPIGTAISEAISFCGGYRCPPTKLLLGGPMMGTTLPDDELPIMKQSNAVLAFDASDGTLPIPSACIRCGRCVRACPMHLMPTMLERAAKAKDVPQLQHLSVMNCMECGSCAFECPASRPLVQAIRVGKGLVRAAQPRK